FNLKTMIRLVLVEDKRLDEALGIDESGEPQLIAAAIAAAMYNRKIINTHNDLRRVISEPPTDESKSPQATMKNTLSTSDVSF
ncbi:unnamed protein product, partial [Rotaria sp. Silwood1]